MSFRGNGTEHPLAPGEQLVLADQGYDFTQTKADAKYRFVDRRFRMVCTETEKGMDPDIAEVPNLDKWYSYSATIWIPNNQANRAYAIARMGVSKDEFLANYYKEYHYTATNGKEMTKKGYDVPVASGFSMPSIWEIPASKESLPPQCSTAVMLLPESPGQTKPVSDGRLSAK